MITCVRLLPLRCRHASALVSPMSRTYRLSRQMHDTKQLDDLRSIYAAAVEAVRPGNLVRRWLTMNDDVLIVGEKRYHLEKPCYVVGFGKAVADMALELEAVMGEHLAGGLIAVPEGSLGGRVASKVEFLEAARDNLPDQRAIAATRKIRELCDGLLEDDLLVVLISGGGSALLCSPREGVTLKAKVDLIRELVLKGADIGEVNVVRTWLSDLKGGGLAEAAYPAGVVALILSDVVGDNLQIIASGPTVQSHSSKGDVFNILQKYQVDTEGQPWADLPNKTTSNFGNVDNFVIGNNKAACVAAKARAENLGYPAAILSTTLTGEVGVAAKMYAEIASKICSSAPGLPNNIARLRPPCCVVAGGEPTVVITGRGKGGRNQHLALAFSKEAAKIPHSDLELAFLSCGTDGIDGPTDAAGAVGYADLYEDATAEGLNPDEFLHNNDSYSFYSSFANGRCLVKTGHSGTNVMDIHVMLVTHKS